MSRVYYYSKTDLSVGYNLELAEQRIAEIKNTGIPTDLAGIIELWHIHKLLDEDCRLVKWSDEKFIELKESTGSYNANVAKYFKSLDFEKIQEEYNNLEWGYRKSFWQIITQFCCFNVIKHETLKSIIEANINDLRSVLSCEKLVDKFKGIIREVLMNSDVSAHILLDKYVAHSIGNSQNIFIPSTLTPQERENIIIKYLDGSSPNINYVRLIGQTKDVDGQFVISPRTRLKAAKLAEKLNDDLMNDPRTSITRFQMDVAFLDDDNAEIVNISTEKGYPSYTYGKKFISECDNEQRIVYCAQVFGWLDKRFMLNLINKNCEVDGLETAFMDRGKNSYPNFQVFEHKNWLALYQMNGYELVLNQMGSSIEKELELFYHQRLSEEFGYPALKVKLPQSGDDWLSKCRIIFPEIDNIARQYNTYVEEDEIDPKYIAFQKPMKMTNAKSLLVNKYCEVNKENDVISSVMFCLFASGALLDYVEPYKDKHYHSFNDLMNNEVVRYEYYELYQKHYVDLLIDQGVVSVNQDGILVFTNKDAVEVLRSVWEYGACSYWHYDKKERLAADDLIAKGWLVTDDHLLSKAERQYFSYYTDNAEFTNGFAYRNHYAHGTTPDVDDVNAHAHAYLVLLRLLIILVLKIYDDLWLARRVFAINATMANSELLQGVNC